MALKEYTGVEEEERPGGGEERKRRRDQEEERRGRGRGGENRRRRRDPDLLSPHGVAGLLEQDFLEVKVLVVVVGLCAGVADVALGVEPLRDLHGVLRPHA